MKRLFTLVYLAVAIIILCNYLYYKSIYNKQLIYVSELLKQQVKVVGLSVDQTNNAFVSDLNQIDFTVEMELFFTNPDNFKRTTDKMKLFYSKYKNFITGIKFYDNKRNEFTLKKDNKNDYNDWIEQSYKLNNQGMIYKQEQLIRDNRKYNYYLPVIDHKTNEAIGNIVVGVDFQKYFSDIFSVFKLKDFQWQWVVTDSGRIIHDNLEKNIEYSQLGKITQGLDAGIYESIIHNARIDGKKTEIISSYYPTQLLQKNFALVFSEPTVIFHRNFVRNSLIVFLITILLIHVIIFIFLNYVRSVKSEAERLRTSEKMLFRIIGDMPVGILIHNKKMEILKANKLAADYYSYKNGPEMEGKIFPETTFAIVDESDTNSSGETSGTDNVIVIKKESGDLVLLRKSAPVLFAEDEAILETLIDVTALEKARKDEISSNEAKSEFLARMSYEIRTPLNGIIGMTDLLTQSDLTPGGSELVRLLRRSTEDLLNIIKNILDFSRIKSGNMMLTEVPFNMREEINDCAGLARTNINPATIKLTVEIDKDIPETIIGDPFRFRQILTNLFNFSISKTQTGVISLRCCLQSRKNAILTLGFELLDTGQSLDETSFKKIFGDIVNIETITVRNNEESFFGTVLARQLIELMGGKFEAGSHSGLRGEEGTRICFTIPSYTNDREEKNISVESIHKLNQVRALVITGNQYRDEDSIAILYKTGMNVNITTFTKTTIGQIKSNADCPDEKYNLLVIFDDPSFDGFEAARSISENHLSKGFFILVISANDKKGNYNRCNAMGVDMYLVKPFFPEDLMCLIRKFFPFLKYNQDAVNLKTDLRILIVEDNKMNQKVLGAMLSNMGYLYDLAEDGYVGYLQAKAKKYDLIFMDLVMPEMDGFEAASRILRFDKSVIIVAFTADNMPETKKKAGLIGINDFISKPVRIDDLKQLLARHFKK